MCKLRVVLAILLIIIILLLPPTTGYDSYVDILRHTSMTLKGQAPYADVAQDIYGFRALMTNQDPYARLKPALKTIGVEWNADFSSTHPPTAFLLVAPVAFLPWPISSMAWAWLMLIALCVSLRFACGYSWDWAFLVTAVVLFWPPIATSFDQITIVWLFGLAMAYHYRNERPLVSGVFIGIASFTKLVPAMLLLPFMLRRNVDAVKGFGLSWLTALVVLLLLSPKALLRYLISNRLNATEIIQRWDNGSFLFFLSRRIGLAGLFVTVIVILLVLVLAYKKYRQASAEELSTEEWNLYAFLAVLVLPITWIFSITPLLPNVLLLLQDKRWIVQVLAICSLIPPILVHPWGTQSTVGLFGFFILAGTAFALAQSDFTWSLKLSKAPSE